MAIKKSELYSSLWASCDALRGGMDASQYKDYVLILLFVKYVSDRYAGDPNSVIEVPTGGSFRAIVKLKGQKDIGEKIDIAIGQLAKANDLENVIDVVSFNDEEKLGKGKEMVDRLSKLVAIFEKPELDFSSNRAQGDDILGDAYEYLMRHFATESGKSKGQFYTPAEVSRIMAKVIGLSNVKSPSQTIYDPACGSGSLLLKAADESSHPVTIYVQEKDVSTAALARMNMILHNNPTAEIVKGQSTISNPLFLDNNGQMKSFDFCVANPPFSLANWTNGFDPFNDEHGRFDGYGTPPEGNGDYAFLLHIIKSMKSTGHGAVILPHGVLFRGNSEAEIRKNIVRRGYIKGIIGLPANLFYGTGIPACIIVLDKETANDRKGIFMIDASKGYMKDGNKNRLREQDIHKIVDVFNKQLEVRKYSRFVPYEEIAVSKNDFNLNIPRYIDGQEQEDIQDIEAHLLGGIPNADIDALENYWEVYPTMRNDLFTKTDRKKYSQLKVNKDQIRHTIFHHHEFLQFSNDMNMIFEGWKERTTRILKGLSLGFKPKELIEQISEDLLNAYGDSHLLDKYDVYQHLMNYWNDVMQDDSYMIAVDGWKAEVYRILVENKKGEQVDKGWACDLLPAHLLVAKYFSNEQEVLSKLEGDRERLIAQLNELEEEHSNEDGVFASLEKVNKINVQKRLKEIKNDRNAHEEKKLLESYLILLDEIGSTNIKIKEAATQLDKKTIAKYPKLSSDEIKQLTVEDKWMNSIQNSIRFELERVSQRLAQRIKDLAERYEKPLPQQLELVASLEQKVNDHLEKMGFTWN